MTEIPPSIAARLRNAKALLEQGRDSDAANLLRLTLALAPDLPEIWLLLAQALTGANRGEEAYRYLIKATEDASTAGDANAMLGYWYQARGRFEDAKACFERAIDINPRQSVSYYGWAQGNRFSAVSLDLVKLAERAECDPATSPDDATGFCYVLGKAYADLGDYGHSMEWFDKANANAHRQNLEGKPFDRAKYAGLFDQTIAMFNRDLFDRNRRVGVSSRTPIIVVGMMRSGTTLVEQILSSHPAVGAAGELEYWLDQGPSAVNLPKRMLFQKQLVSISESYTKLLRSVAPGRPYVVDKMPQNFQMLGHIHLGLPKAPIIHVRRNPIDTCLSIYTTAYQLSPSFAHVKESICFAYRQYQRLMAHWRKVLPPDRFLEIDYEELVSDRETVIRQLVDFCGLEWDAACLYPENNDRVVVTPSLWQVRQPINSGAVGKWRAYEPWLGAFGQLL